MFGVLVHLFGSNSCQHQAVAISRPVTSTVQTIAPSLLLDMKEYHSWYPKMTAQGWRASQIFQPCMLVLVDKSDLKDSRYL